MRGLSHYWKVLRKKTVPVIGIVDVMSHNGIGD